MDLNSLSILPMLKPLMGSTRLSGYANRTVMVRFRLYYSRPETVAVA